MTITNPKDTPRSDPSGASIVCFDGVCGLCHRSVHWVIQHDPKGVFRFASLQSQIAERLLAGRVQQKIPEGIVLISGKNIWFKSDAWIQIFERIDPPWSLLRVFKIIPKNIRDRIYDAIAARRYRWFGKLSACPMPDPKVKDRFLE